MKNIIQKVNSMSGKINPHYDMSMKEMNEIFQESNDPFDLVYYSFNFGYMQGIKALQSELKRGGYFKWMRKKYGKMFPDMKVYIRLVITEG